MEDAQRAVKIFCELQKDLVKSEDSVKSKHLKQLILLLESSFYYKMIILHKSLDELRRQNNVRLEDLYYDEATGSVKAKMNHVSIKNDRKVSLLSEDDFNKRVKLIVGKREMLHIPIEKSSPSQTLGFIIKCSGSAHSNGVFIESVTKGSLADRSGIKEQYQIVAIDGVPLDNPDTNREVAIQALKSNHSIIDIILARDKSSTLLAPPRDTGHTRNRSDQITSKELNTEWTQYEVIDISSVDGTFGFGIMGGLTCDVMVRTILSGGSADMDGRLCVNDHIMYINEQPVRKMSSNQVAEILKSAGQRVRLVVARPFDQSHNNSGDGRIQMVETTSLDVRLDMIVAQLSVERSDQRNVKEKKHSVAIARTRHVPSVESSSSDIEEDFDGRSVSK